MTVPEIDLTDPDLLKDPFASYGRLREQSPIARIPMPGIGRVWAVLRHQDARAMLGDPRFAITNGAAVVGPAQRAPTAAMVQHDAYPPTAAPIGRDLSAHER